MTDCCRLGPRGSLVWFVADATADDDHLRVDDAWTEWGSMVGAPIER